MTSSRSVPAYPPARSAFHRLDERVLPMCFLETGERLKREPERVSSLAGVQDTVFAGGSSPT